MELFSKEHDPLQTPIDKSLPQRDIAELIATRNDLVLTDKPSTPLINRPDRSNSRLQAMVCFDSLNENDNATSKFNSNSRPILDESFSLTGYQLDSHK